MVPGLPVPKHRRLRPVRRQVAISANVHCPPESHLTFLNAETFFISSPQCISTDDQISSTQSLLHEQLMCQIWLLTSIENRNIIRKVIILLNSH